MPGAAERGETVRTEESREQRELWVLGCPAALLKTELVEVHVSASRLPSEPAAKDMAWGGVAVTCSLWQQLLRM
jgi:hypothetical protein